MKKFGKRLDLDRFDFSPTLEQKICLSLSNLRKKKSKNERKGINTPLLVPNANYGNEEFEKDQIEENYIKQRLERYNIDPKKEYQHPKTFFAKGNFPNEDFALNPEDYGINPETFWILQQNILNTPQSRSLAHNLTMHPQKYEDITPISYPLVERRIEPAKKLLIPNPNVFNSNVPSEQCIEKDKYIRMLPHIVRTMPQPSLVDQNVGMEAQRYKDRPMPISYAQADRRTDHAKKIYAEVAKGKPMLKLSEDMNKGRVNRGIRLHDMQQQPHSFAPHNFGVQHDCDEMPISYVQTERRTEPPREMLFAQAVQGKGNAPVEDNWRLNRQSRSMAQNFEISQQRHENNQLIMSYPQIERRSEKVLMDFTGNDNNLSGDIGVDAEYIDTDINEMGVGTDDMRMMQQNIEQTTQQKFEDPTFEMVKQRYENISPPTPNYQTEMCINYKNKSPLAEAAGNSPPAPTGDIVRESENITMKRQNFQHTRFPQNFEMDRQRYEVVTRPSNVRNVPLQVPSENVGIDSDNIGILQQNMGQTSQQRFVDPTFEMNRRRYEELMRPITRMLPHTEDRTKPARRVLFPEATGSNENTQYVPYDNSGRVEENIRKMHQNLAQSREMFNHTFEMEQQSEEMAQSNLYQPPLYVDPNTYNARARQPSRSGYRHPQSYLDKNLDTPPQLYQPQQPHPVVFNSQYTQPHPQHYYVPRYRLINQKQMQHESYCHYNQYHNQHNFNYNAARCNKTNSQQQLLLLQQIAMQQQSYYHNQYYAQNSTNSNATRQQNMIQEQQQQLQHRIEMHQRSYECYQFYGQQNNTKR